MHHRLEAKIFPMAALSLIVLFALAVNRNSISNLKFRE